MQSGKYDRRIRIERMGQATVGEFGKRPGEWESVLECWAIVQDILPKRSEESAADIRLGTDQTKVRLRFRNGITSDMRVVVLGSTERTLSIISGPVEIGRRQELEFMAERFTS
jgi:SPP1 family predicted phage head-tail adaptor